MLKMNKRFYSTLSFCCLLNCSLFSQWVQQNSNTTNHLQGVYFPVKDTGYTVGKNSTILKTTDGGNTWNVLSDSGTNIYQSVYFITASKGFVVGTNEFGSGALLTTQNGGVAWDTTIINNGSLNCVYFFNDNIGYMANSFVLYKTTDGGNNWSSADSTSSISDIYFTSVDTGFATASGSILKTTDGGFNWLVVYDDPNVGFLSRIHFANKAIGYAAGAYPGWLAKTTDGGNTWTDMGFPQSWWLDDVFFTAADTGYVIYYDNILKTTNGGVNWNILNSDSAVGFKSIYFVDKNTGFAVGDNGVILKTINAGGPVGIEKKASGNKISIYPNPTIASANIEYNIVNKNTLVNLEVFNLQGQKVASLVNNLIREPGTYQVKFNASSLPGGIYFYKFKTADFIEIGKLVLAKIR